ncbi:NADH:flavin oxidoreductase [Chloroflexota bacterium]
MKSIFEPQQINRIVLKNRFVRSATMDNFGIQGMVSDSQLHLYKELSKGEIGLIITGGLFPRKDGQDSFGQLGIHTDETIPPLKKLVSIVHKNNDKIAAQILHGGWQCRPEVTGSQPVGPTAILNPNTGLQVRELSGDEILELIESFVQAARRIIEAGFDAVQVHSAHSWLLSSFLSPVTNRRSDKWGGSTVKRSEFLRLICQGIRNLAGPNYPIFIKLGFRDYHPYGKTLSEGIEIARLLESDGIDAFELSEGLEAEWGNHIRPDAIQPYYLRECRVARQALSRPLFLVGGMRNLNDMQAVLDEGTADAVSMCRPFIRDPHIIRKFREGLTDSSDCNSCNECCTLMLQGNIHCTLP